MNKLTKTTIKKFAAHLNREEKSEATIEKYTRYAQSFLNYLGSTELTKEAVIKWKKGIADQYTAAGANGMISSVNSFLRFIGCPDMCVNKLRTQRVGTLAPERNLEYDDLKRLIDTAEQTGCITIARIMGTILATGIRVSELPFITFESAVSGAATVRLKGKTRSVIVPTDLGVCLLAYAAQKGITSGPIFIDKNGKPLNRRAVWHGMKALCAEANVQPEAVFPHNLRKLFARMYYAQGHNLAELAEILGHSDINTTRRYVATTSAQIRKNMDSLVKNMGLFA